MVPRRGGRLLPSGLHPTGLFVGGLNEPPPTWLFTLFLFLIQLTSLMPRRLPPQEWSYMRGGLSTIDRDYGVFNKIHHDIGTHVVHHLFPQIPHYHLCEATEAVKPVLGEFYR